MEIGSEFWIENDFIVDPAEQFYMSGRSALNAIIMDAIRKYGIQRALLPSYCCDSVIIPFINNDILVRFYDVFLNDDHKISMHIPKAEDDELLFFMHFFGVKISHLQMDGDMRDWAAVIEDQTHSFFSGFKSEIDPHYTFVSFRKWFAVSGIAMAKSEAGILPRTDKTNPEYIALRNQALLEKSRYINGEDLNKGSFLDKFRKAEETLDEDYSCYAPDPKDYYRLVKSIRNQEKMIAARRANAAVLLQEIASIEQLSVIVDFDMEKDCPMFVPIVEMTGHRTELRNYLIKNEVYCPVHWPISSYHKELNDGVKTIYENELSLVCDQRYTPDDMMRIIWLIKDFYSIS